ncbi:MAG: hypothetical protein GX790_10340 [Syntrophomonadaceae bacterium]|nr:hypothetical protein [Syntrophomonadaceae bacterium]
MIANADNTVTYHCFNCGFKASWKPGRNVTGKLKKLMQWFNVPDDIISKLALYALKEKEDESFTKVEIGIPTFETSELPAKSQLISETTELSKPFVSVVEYMQRRQLFLDDYPFYWTKDFSCRNRLVIPFYYEGRIVGWTGRAVLHDMKPRYHAYTPVGYVFNLDSQTSDKAFAIICEGVIDALYIGAAALLGSSISDQQALLINRLNKDIIVVPDRDEAGQKLVEQSIDRGWQVSMPDWGPGINDIGEAVEAYGRVYTLYSIAIAAEEYPLKIRLRAKKWFVSYEY